jgi:crotonobetainyl-CoA:carnitine CoA-transferase CaiB-like acyl-CoA transferase
VTAPRRPLTGIRVVDAGTFLAAPYAAMMLGDLGADVIKVEAPAGDPYRRFGRPRGPVSAVFANANRAKRGIALDLKDGADHASFCALLRAADVLIENWRPGAADRLGFGTAALDELNARLVHCSITGFGPTGPLAGDPVFDSVIQARSGLAWLQGDDHAPRFAAGWLVDKLAATMAAQSVLAGLLDRQRSDRGCHIDISMLDAAAYLDFPELFSNRTFVDEQPNNPRAEIIAANRPIRATDGWLIVGAVTGDQIKRACAAVGHPEWVAELFAAADGAQMVRQLVERLESVTCQQPLVDAVRRFTEHDVPAAPVLDPDAHLADPQVTHNALYEIIERPALGRVREVRHPAVSPAWGRLGARGGAPLLDADREEILAEARERIP